VGKAVYVAVVGVATGVQAGPEGHQALMRCAKQACASVQTIHRGYAGVDGVSRCQAARARTRSHAASLNGADARPAPQHAPRRQRTQYARAP